MLDRLLPRPAALLVVTGLAAALLSACGGSGDDGPGRADVMAARTARAQASQQAQRTATTTATAAPGALTASEPWVPQLSDTWQWQLTGTIKTTYDVTVYDVDLFDAPDAVLATLRSQGKRIVCYFSAGSSENWRADFSRFKAADKGNTLDGWAGERWLDTRSANVRAVMKSRLDLAQARGCDGVEPDNVDGYTNKPGFALSASTQLDYNRFLATEAHVRGLKIGLKNDIAQLAALAPSFDFAINEQCNQYSECGGYAAFTNAGKPVFNAEYRSLWRTDATARAQMCAKARVKNLRTLVLPLSLNGTFRYSC